MRFKVIEIGGDGLFQLFDRRGDCAVRMKSA